MSSTDQAELNININQASSKQLKQVIQKLINKSKLLIENLQSTIKQLQNVTSQKQYWKKTYFNFKQACENYIQSHGIAPFQYMVNLQTQLKSNQLQKHLIYSKLNEKTIQKTDFQKRSNLEKTKPFLLSQRKQQQVDLQTSINKISPNNFSQHKNYYSKRKHEIGPKKIQLFKSKDKLLIKK